jgi:predicted component of type VI protein secretion system
MKVSLVVASGAHEGKVIPLIGPQFLIGRDQQCHLRPASPAISKLHCAVLLRDGRVYVKDFGSTNGTLVNDELIQNVEVHVQDGATIRVGPLDFRVKIERPAPTGAATPLPSGATAAAVAAVKAAAGGAAKAPTPARDATPNPARPSGVTAPPGARPDPAKTAGVTAPTKPAAAPPAPPAVAAGGSKEHAALPSGAGEGPSLSSAAPSEEDHDRIAAMLLGMDESGNGSVPEGSTVMDMPVPAAVGSAGTPTAAGDAASASAPGAAPGSASGEAKPGDKPKPAQTREEMSSAANDLLRKYMRRPK